MLSYSECADNCRNLERCQEAVKKKNGALPPIKWPSPSFKKVPPKYDKTNKNSHLNKNYLRTRNRTWNAKKPNKNSRGVDFPSA